MDFEKFSKVQNIVKTHQAGYVPAGEYVATVKMDGANAGIIKTEFGLQLHSRNTYLGEITSASHDTAGWNGLQGFVQFVVKRFDHFYNLMSIGDHVYGEWLVPHTITYPNEMYRKFYIFDEEFYFLQNEDLNVTVVPALGSFIIPDQIDSHELGAKVEHLIETYTKTVSGKHKTEGAVLKHIVTRERFKLVSTEFKEDNGVKFNTKSFDASHNLEVELAGKYPIRSYDKVLEKVKTLKSVEALSKQHIPAVLGLAWHDYTTEFLGDVLANASFPTVNTRVLKTEFENRIRTIYITELDTGIRPVWAVDR